MGTPVLTTARLRLRPLAATDETAVVAALGDPLVSRWLTHVPYPYAAAHFRDFLARDISNPGALWAVDEGETFCGVVGLSGSGPELGYWYGTQAWGRGIATEAGRAVVADAFAQGAARIGSGYADGNPASGAVLAKLGFEDRGPRTLGTDPSAVRDFPGRRVELTRARWEAVQ